jgi:hypothetical protein
MLVIIPPTSQPLPSWDARYVGNIRVRFGSIHRARYSITKPLTPTPSSLSPPCNKELPLHLSPALLRKMKHHRHLGQRKVLADASLLVDPLDRVLGEAVMSNSRGRRVRGLSGIVVSAIYSFSRPSPGQAREYMQDSHPACRGARSPGS